MKFKSISLHGFKSFVDKSHIQFADGISCIIGPNGSGKSNILDAIRWIFGEQNVKELRGLTMEDVVFSGSDTRKTMNLASVSLTLSDIDAKVCGKWGGLSELTITRKYYRTGNRENYINNQKCRLKDISELFYDTGLGAKSFSVVEQGKVERIIQASPENLREFFEEAAGIVRSREQKKETERRLKNTVENLRRINDVISEVKSKEISLSEQTKRLDAYKNLYNKKELLSKQYLCNNFYSYYSKFGSTEEDINHLNEQLSSHMSFMDKLKCDMDNMVKELNLSEDKSKGNDRLFVDKKNDLNRSETDLKFLVLKMEKGRKDKGTISDNIKIVKERVEKYEDKKGALLSLREELSDGTVKIKNNLREKNNEYAVLKDTQENINKELVVIDRDYLQYIDKISALKNEILACDLDIKRLDKEHNKLGIEYISMGKEYEDYCQKQKNVSEKLSCDKDLLEKVRIKENNLREEIFSVKENYKETEIEYKNFETRVITSKERKKILEDIIEETKYGHLDNKEIFEGLKSKLLIECMDNVDKRLITNVGDVIVFLEDNQELVYDRLNKAKGTVRFIFKKDIGYMEKKLQSHSYKVIRDDIHYVDGIYIKFGADNRGVKLIKYKDELVAVSETLSDNQEKLKKVENMLNKYKNKLAASNNEMNKIKGELNKRFLSVGSLEKEYNLMSGVIERFDKRKQIIEKEKEICSEEKKSLEGKKIDMGHRLDDITGEYNSFLHKKNVLEKSKVKLQKELEDSNDTISELNMDLLRKEERVRSINNEITYLEDEIDKIHDDLKKMVSNLKILEERDLIAWRKDIEDKKKYIGLINDELDQFNQNMIAFEEKTGFIKEEIAEKKNNIDKANNIIIDYNSQLNAKEVSKARLETVLASIRETFYDKYYKKIEDEYKNYLDEQFKANQIKNLISKLESQLSGLGPLNMAAEEEMMEIKDRLSFLETQKDDLEKAIDSINKLVMDINNNSENKFGITFESVRKNFKKVFSILFGDGIAEIKLTDRSDLLSSGVEVFIQPPGKKLQSMSLLSGGEKAMAACTLLFAFFLYKPTPICFLDEIDAPLDDANIARFLKIVRELSKDTQFVIITHNQKTMSEADALYGVTMQEAGISSVLSVEMSQGNTNRLKNN